jgi:hypothetical protein
MLATLIFAAYLSYLLFESRTYHIRIAAKRIFLHRLASKPGGSTVSTGS